MIFSNKERQAPTVVTEAEPTHLVRYNFALNFIKNTDNVLDIPCGTGYGSKLISTRSNKTTGLDICTEAIDHAIEFFGSDNIEYMVGNAESLKDIFPIKSLFDVIVSFEGIEHLKNQESFLDGVSGLLKKDGLLIISTPRKPHGSPYHTVEFSREEFKDILSEFFIVEKMFGQIYTEIFDLEEKIVDPHSFKKFNYIALCRVK